jgi:hypothetical protein
MADYIYGEDGTPILIEDGTPMLSEATHSMPFAVFGAKTVQNWLDLLNANVEFNALTPEQKIQCINFGQQECATLDMKKRRGYYLTMEYDHAPVYRVTAAMTLPKPIITADLISSMDAIYEMIAAINLPKPVLDIALSAARLLHADITLPKPTLDIQLMPARMLNAEITLPKPTVSADIVLSKSLTAAIVLPKPQLSCALSYIEGYQDYQMAAFISIPKHTFTITIEYTA